MTMLSFRRHGCRTARSTNPCTAPGASRATSIYYLAHDLNDPAILRRLKQLERGGAKVSLGGFTRHSSSHHFPTNVVCHFGITRDGRLGRRILSVVRTALLVRRWGPTACNTDVLIARNLEMMVLALVLRLTFCPGVPLVYECLDVHRIMISHRSIGRGLRLLEKCLLGVSSLLIVSSPDFLGKYFRPTYRALPPTMLWENKLTASEWMQRGTAARSAASAPWRIGWFGVIRCQRSLAVLQRLCVALPGCVEVDIRGRPTAEILPTLTAAVAATPGLSFMGAYNRSRDLASIYGGVHFTWAIDFFEDGANSAWLLPNRLYEGAAHSAVPIALKAVQTGRWLLEHDVGVVFDDLSDTSLPQFFKSLDTRTYLAMVAKLEALDASVLHQNDNELVSIVGRLSQLPLPRLLSGT